MWQVLTKPLSALPLNEESRSTRGDGEAIPDARGQNRSPTPRLVLTPPGMIQAPSSFVNGEHPSPKTNPNRVRDHLANERTYLAWIRTAIAMMGFGVLIVRLRFDPNAAPHGHGWELGLVFAFGGILMAWGANGHFHNVRRSIDSDTYEPHSRWVTACSALVALVGLGVLAYLFTSPAAPPLP